MLPLIICLCPTYKRSEMLANSVQCFLDQDYPNKYLLVFDDAAQHSLQQEETWEVVSLLDRYSTLSQKFNAMGFWAMDNIIPKFNQQDIIFAVWEDDDIYLPHHLSGIAAQYKPGEATFFVPDGAWSNYDQERGTLIQEGSDGRFHAGWAYSVDLWKRVSGYPLTTRLDFDQRMNAICRREADRVSRYNTYPSYVYRWGSGPWNGSQVGEKGWRQFWDRLGDLQVPKVEKLVPRYDDETLLVMESYAEKLDAGAIGSRD